MKISRRRLKWERVLSEFRHGQLRDIAKKSRAHMLKRAMGRRLKFPFMVQVEVTNDCILDCIMCPHSQIEEKPGYMSYELFKRILDECSWYPSLGELVFSGMGEPLLHPRLPEMTRYAKGQGIPKVRVTTNALLLTKEKAVEILEDSGLDQISFSLDALTPQTYTKIKRRSCFQTVQENILYFLTERKKRRKWKPFVHLHILKMKETASEISGFVRQWRPLLERGDLILPKYFHTFAGQVENRALERRSYDGKRRPCLQLWQFLYVSWNGDVMPCCADALKKMRVGKLQGSSIQALWNDSSLQEMRDIHIQGQYDRLPLCKQCTIWWYLGKKPHWLSPKNSPYDS